MKRLIVLVLAVVSASQAGVFSVATYPLRHPLRTQKKAALGLTYPVRHPVKFIR